MIFQQISSCRNGHCRTRACAEALSFGKQHIAAEGREKHAEVFLGELPCWPRISPSSLLLGASRAHVSSRRVQARLLSSAGSVPLPPDLAMMPPVSPPSSSWGTGGTAALGQPWAQAARVKGLGGPYGLCVSFQGFSPVLLRSLAPGFSSVLPRSCHARQEGGPRSCCGLVSPVKGHLPLSVVSQQS